jgi:hypothetical protein
MNCQKNTQKDFSWSLGIILLNLSLKTILIEEILENKDTFKDNSF